MASFQARIVLLGKSTSVKSKKIHQEILNTLQPTEVPKEFIDSITVTFANDEVIPFDVSKLKGNFSLDEVHNFLKSHKAEDKVDTIEIAINLDVVSKQLESKSNSLLNKHFK